MAVTEALRLLVTADTRGAVQGVEKLGSTADRELGRSTKAIDKWGHGLTKAGAGMVTFGAVAVAGLLQAGSAASDLNEVASKSATVFGEANEKVDDFASSAAKIGLSKRAALEAASGFGNMFDQLGVASDKAADMSIQVTKLASDFASFHNADITEVLEAQSAAFRGEYDSIQKFLPLLSAATVEQRAMALTGKENKDSLTAQDKALAVYKLMLEGAGQAQGDFARTSDSAANQQRVLAAEFENAKSALGQGVLPVMQTGLGIANKLVGAFTQLNAVTNGTAGKLATFGAVGLVAVGGLSMLAGAAIQARTNLAAIGSGLTALTARFATMGAAAQLALGVAGIGLLIFVAHQFSQAANRVAVDVDMVAGKLGNLSDTNRESLREMVASAEAFGQLDEVVAQTADTNAVAAERLVSLAESMGLSADRAKELRDIIAEKRREDAQATVDQEANTEAVDKGAAAMREGADATKTAAESLDEQAEAAKKAKEELDALNAELDALLSRYLSVDQAIAKQNQGFLEVGAHLKEMREEHGRNAFALDVTTEAGIKNTEMLDGLVESAAGVIEKMREEGATEEEVQAQWASSRGQLQGVLQQFRDNGVEVGKYDALLRAVDSQVATQVVVRGGAEAVNTLEGIRRRYDGAVYRAAVEVAVSQRGGLNIGGGVRVFHEGGVVPGPRGQEVAAILQAGEEVLDLNNPRNVANARHVAPAFAGVGSAGGGRPARVVIDVTGADRQMVEMLRRMISVEGGGDVQVALGQRR